MRRLLVAVALLLAVAGCGATATDDTAPAPTASAGRTASIAEQQQATGGEIPGYRVTIPKLDVSSTLVGLGLNSDRTIQVPKLNAPMQAGVYLRGPMLGEVGPAVVLAHVNAGGKPGFGAGFHNLAVGDLIDAATPSGPVAYRVYDVITVDKSRYPVARIFSDTAGAELRLITCGPGPLDASGRNYLNQTVVFARKM